MAADKKIVNFESRKLQLDILKKKYLTMHQLRNIVAVPPIDIFSWVRIDSILSDLYLILAIWGYGKRLKNIVSIDAIGVRPLFGALNVRFFFIFGIIGLNFFDFSILRHSYPKRSDSF